MKPQESHDHGLLAVSQPSLLRTLGFDMTDSDCNNDSSFVVALSGATESR